MKIGGQGMIKRVITLLLVVVFIASISVGCGSASKSSPAADFGGSNGNAVNESVSAQFSSDAKVSGVQTTATGKDSAAEPAKAPAPAPAATSESDALAGGNNVTQEVSNAILAERKIIRSANVTLEVTDFDEAYGKINSFILGIGFIQETNINSEKTYVDNKLKLVKRGSIIVRVDKDKFDKVLNNVKGIGDVLNWNINGQDVTDKYFDIESRLRLLKLEQSSVEEYLKKLTDLDQIFKAETRLTDIRYEIEGLTGNLNKMSNLVELATITINMNEIIPGSSNVQIKEKTYGQRVLDNLLDSIKGVGKFLGELLIILVAALPVIILLGVFILLVLFIYRRVPRKDKVKAVHEKALKENDSGRDNGIQG